MPLLTVFLKLPHFDEHICREIDISPEATSLEALKEILEVSSTGQELLVNHPRFQSKFSLVEETKQLFDGCSIQLVIPKRRIQVRREVYSSDSDLNPGSYQYSSSLYHPVCWYPGSSIEEVETTILNTLGLKKSSSMCTILEGEGGERIALSLSLPQEAKLTVKQVPIESKIQIAENSAQFGQGNSTDCESDGRIRQIQQQSNSSEGGGHGGGGHQESDYHNNINDKSHGLRQNNQNLNQVTSKQSISQQSQQAQAQTQSQVQPKNLSYNSPDNRSNHSQNQYQKNSINFDSCAYSDDENFDTLTDEKLSNCNTNGKNQQFKSEQQQNRVQLHYNEKSENPNFTPEIDYRKERNFRVEQQQFQQSQQEEFKEIEYRKERFRVDKLGSEWQNGLRNDGYGTGNGANSRSPSPANTQQYQYRGGTQNQSQTQTGLNGQQQYQYGTSSVNIQTSVPNSTTTPHIHDYHFYSNREVLSAEDEDELNIQVSEDYQVNEKDRERRYEKKKERLQKNKEMIMINKQDQSNQQQPQIESTKFGNKFNSGPGVSIAGNSNNINISNRTQYQGQQQHVSSQQIIHTSLSRSPRNRSHNNSNKTQSQQTLEQKKLQQKLGRLPNTSIPGGKISQVDESCVHILQGHQGFVLSLTAIGDVLFTGSQDATIIIWDLNTLEYIGTLSGHKSFVKCLTGSYSRRLLFSGSRDKTIRCWSLESFNCIQELKGHTEEIYSLKLLERSSSSNGNNSSSPGDLSLLISGSEDRSIRVWDLSSPTFETLLVIDQAHDSGIFCLETLSDTILLTGSRDRTIKLWDLADRWNLLKTLSPPHYDGVTSTAVSRKLNEFYTVSRDRSIKSWDIFSLRNVNNETNAHGDWITCCLVGGGVCTSPNSKNADKKDNHNSNTSSASKTASASDLRNTDRFLFTGSKDSTIRVWDLETMECLDCLQGHKGPISDLVMVNQYLFSASYDRTVRVWVIQY